MAFVPRCPVSGGNACEAPGFGHSFGTIAASILNSDCFCASANQTFPLESMPIPPGRLLPTPASSSRNAASTGSNTPILPLVLSVK
jgi:hypothetical protein